MDTHIHTQTSKTAISSIGSLVSMILNVQVISMDYIKQRYKQIITCTDSKIRGMNRPIL